MKVQLRFFASLREQLGAQSELVLPEGTTVGQAREVLMARDAIHAQALDRSRALRSACNQTLCGDDLVLQDGDELAFFPPVTGG